jgi:hypothetical protein
MRLARTFLITISIFSVLSCRTLAQESFVENNRSFVWAEVPDALSNPEPGNPNVELEPWFIDLNSIVRHGDVVIFEGVHPEGTYNRFQGNCGTNEMRTLYIGDFLSASSIVYYYASDELSLAEGWRLALLNFACSE